MKLLNSILILMILFVCDINAQYFAPLKTGNVWVWENWDWHTIERTTVVDTNFYIGDTAYCKINLYSTYDSSFAYERFDAHDQIYYKYDIHSPQLNYNFPFYKKNFQMGDTIVAASRVPGVQNVRYLVDIWENASVFGIITSMKFLHWNAGGLVEGNQIWTEEFGMLYSEVQGVLQFQLRGCIIDGIVYGDTTILDVKLENSIPAKFKLYQNYPNPFNPSTTIRYQIPEDGMVTLKVYDILGSEIKTLVNDFKTKGCYEVAFDASNFASGLYIYEIQSGDYKASKKMTLLK
jgi:hypothetical protein